MVPPRHRDQSRAQNHAVPLARGDQRLADGPGRCARYRRAHHLPTRNAYRLAPAVSAAASATLNSQPAQLSTSPMTTPVLRAHAEDQFAEELEALVRVDDKAKPPNWKLSPWAVSTYLLGGDAG